MNIAFAGLRHSHIYVLYEMAKNNPHYTIVGAFESNKNAKAQAEQNGIAVSYESLEALLCDPKVEAVALGGCFGDRGKMAIEALKAGKHVIADKPLCTSLSELDEIERLAKQKRLFVSCMLTMRFESKIRAVKELQSSGTLGEINNIYFGGQHPLQYGRRPEWYYEPGKHGGTINDIAIHAVDAIRFMLGLEIESVSAARCWNRFADCEPNFKDSAQLMAVADNGAGILGDVSYSIPDGVEFSLPYYWQFYLWGTKGVIRFSLNEKESHYFVAGDPEPKVLDESEIKTDYLTDFYNLVCGKKDIVITPEEVFSSTRKALEIQKSSNLKGDL
ncbi:MAG: Gfo/Idh/MocA family oxidoreductase [Clostridia bacterium]|nr:Gfo/Idh/MocA family oxidoreductase [Clostridia bacterium]